MNKEVSFKGVQSDLDIEQLTDFFLFLQENRDDRRNKENKRYTKRWTYRTISESAKKRYNVDWHPNLSATTRKIFKPFILSNEFVENVKIEDTGSIRIKITITTTLGNVTESYYHIGGRQRPSIDLIINKKEDYDYSGEVGGQGNSIFLNRHRLDNPTAIRRIETISKIKRERQPDPKVETDLEQDPYWAAKEELAKIGISEEDFMEWIQ